MSWSAPLTRGPLTVIGLAAAFLILAVFGILPFDGWVAHQAGKGLGNITREFTEGVAEGFTRDGDTGILDQYTTTTTTTVSGRP